jgi:bile acid:Na+ symporter, BASS family
MSIQSLNGLGFTLSIFLGVVAVGMRVAPADLPYVLSNPARLARSLLAMNVLAPIAAVVVCKIFSLHPAVIVALVTLSIAPVGSLFSANMMPLVTPGHAAYARGLFFASTVLSVILTPLAVEMIQLIFGGDVHVNPLAVTKVVVGSVLLPLGIGLVIGRWWPATRRWIPAIQTVSSLVLLVCAVVLIAGTWSLMGSVVRTWTTTAESLEAVVGTGYSFFHFDDPEASLDASLFVLPSLTESGRLRSEAKLRSRYEIINDLFFEVSLYGSYDTDADATADSKSDYGMTTSLGYSF